jgi:uncharacterized protein
MGSDHRRAGAGLRIGFDLDGVLADMESELLRQAEQLFGEPPLSVPLSEPVADMNTPGDTSGEPAEITPPALKVRMTTRQQRRLWKHVASIDNFWEGLAEIEPGAVARLAAVASPRRWEVIFLTKRPETAGRTAQVQTQRWLASKGFEMPSVFVVQGSRGKIAAALDLDIVVDDRPESCMDVSVDSQARPILVWRDKQKPLPAGAQRLGIGSVRSIHECLDILIQIDTQHQREQPGVIDRVLRLLGLRQASQV